MDSRKKMFRERKKWSTRTHGSHHKSLILDTQRFNLEKGSQLNLHRIKKKTKEVKMILKNHLSPKTYPIVLICQYQIIKVYKMKRLPTARTRKALNNLDFNGQKLLLKAKSKNREQIIDLLDRMQGRTLFTVRTIPILTCHMELKTQIINLLKLSKPKLDQF